MWLLYCSDLNKDPFRQFSQLVIKKRGECLKYTVLRPRRETRKVLNSLEKAVVILSDEMAVSFANTSAHTLLDLYKTRTYNGANFINFLQDHGWSFENMKDVSIKTLQGIADSQGTLTIYKNVSLTQQKYKTLSLQKLDTETLSGYVCEITKLSEARDELRKQQTFIRMIGHEAKQPLSIMKAHIYRLKKSQTQEVKDELLQNLNFQIDNIANMLTDLAESLKMKNKRFEINKEKTNSKELFYKSVKEIRDLYPKHRFNFKFLSKNEQEIDLDRVRFGQIVRNLVSNAAKYGDPKEKIYISANLNSDGLILKVTNFGEVIPEETIKTIFDPYVRNHSLKEKKGLGLGLYIVREIVKLHGGNISVRSEEGKTTFTVFFTRH